MLGYHARFTGCYQRNTYANSRLHYVTCAVTLLLAGCGDPQVQSSDTPVVNGAPVAQSEHERLNAYLAEVFADNVARQPFTATILVLKIDKMSGTRNRKLFGMRNGRGWKLDWLSSTGSIAQRYPRWQLSLDLYRMSLERSLMVDDFRHHAYALQFRGAHTSIPSSP